MTVKNLQPLNLEKLHPLVHTALNAWKELKGTPEDLLAGLLLVKEQRAKMPQDNMALRLAANHVLWNGIEVLGQQDETSAQILKLRFLEGDTILMTAQKFQLSGDQIKRRQRQAIERLSKIIYEQEMALRWERAKSLKSNLEAATYTELFGIEQAHQTIATQLLSPDIPWVVAIIGIGGIGKSSLADNVIRHIIDHFYYEQVVWLHVDSQVVHHAQTSPLVMLNNLMGQLDQKLCAHLSPEPNLEQRNLRVSQMLKALPHLIVIDNLEVESDMAYLIDHLNELANPSKFLLTTRTRLPGQAHVFNFALQELSLGPSMKLIRHHAQLIGLGDLAQATPKQVQTIYDVVGGNPLALKLVVSLAAVLPLKHVLDDLIKVKSTEIEELYRHIYWQARRSLREDSRTLLEIMPIVANVGVKPEAMLAMSRLSEEQLWPAITELANRSLLEVRGSTWERRYSIHRLTETFLRTEIIDWPEDLS